MPELTDELRALLAERRYATLATHDPEGTIHLTPVWFLFDDGRFYFASFAGSRKIENLRRNPSASVIIDARSPGEERWLSAWGPAEILAGDDASVINAGIRRRYLTQDALDDARIEPVFAAADDVTIRLTPAGWRSWAVSDVDERHFGGLLGRTPERWFLPVER
jgi:PPOX class probable F420-dependent enzyme